MQKFERFWKGDYILISKNIFLIKYHGYLHFVRTLFMIFFTFDIPRRHLLFVRENNGRRYPRVLCKSAILTPSLRDFPLVVDFAPAIFGHCSAREVSSRSSASYLFRSRLLRSSCHIYFFPVKTISRTFFCFCFFYTYGNTGCFFYSVSLLVISPL